MAAEWYGFLGVVVGGSLTICCQAAAELIKARVATTQLTERRAQLAREHQRATLMAVSDAMKAYRGALEQNGDQVIAAPKSDTAVSHARAEYQSLVFRIADLRARESVQAWHEPALLWFQENDDSTASREDDAWAEAMRELGRAILGTD